MEPMRKAHDEMLRALCDAKESLHWATLREADRT
jgi:hypothetical protein